VKDPKDEQDQEVVNFRLENKLIVPIVPVCLRGHPTGLSRKWCKNRQWLWDRSLESGTAPMVFLCSESTVGG